MQDKTTAQLQMILVVVAPPLGVTFAVQRGRDQLLEPFASTAELISFAVSLNLGPALAAGAFNFQGPYAQGAPSDRFIYVNSGTHAGQADSRWDRRAKLKLAGIPRDLVKAAGGDPDRAIEACFPGTARDGGPVCATVRSDAIAWRLAMPNPTVGTTPSPSVRTQPID